MVWQGKYNNRYRYWLQWTFAVNLTYSNQYYAGWNACFVLGISFQLSISAASVSYAATVMNVVLLVLHTALMEAVLLQVI